MPSKLKWRTGGEGATSPYLQLFMVRAGTGELPMLGYWDGHSIREQITHDDTGYGASDITKSIRFSDLLAAIQEGGG